MESGIQLKDSGILLTIGIQNPSSTDKYWNPVPGIRNPHRGIQNPGLSWIPYKWGELFFYPVHVSCGRGVNRYFKKIRYRPAVSVSGFSGFVWRELRPIRVKESMLFQKYLHSCGRHTLRRPHSPMLCFDWLRIFWREKGYTVYLVSNKNIEHCH